MRSRSKSAARRRPSTRGSESSRCGATAGSQRSISNGSQSVTPDASTSYRLVAKGPGGQQDATTRVTVNTPAPPPPQQGPFDPVICLVNPQAAQCQPTKREPRSTVVRRVLVIHILRLLQKTVCLFEIAK